MCYFFFFFQAEDGIRDVAVTGVQTCALPILYRWYRAEHYARRVELIREHLPHAAIGADAIAGFPGETEEDHAATLAFIESLSFTYLHVFSYSKRSEERRVGKECRSRWSPYH